MKKMLILTPIVMMAASGAFAKVDDAAFAGLSLRGVDSRHEVTAMNGAQDGRELPFIVAENDGGGDHGGGDHGGGDNGGGDNGGGDHGGDDNGGGDSGGGDFGGSDHGGADFGGGNDHGDDHASGYGYDDDSYGTNNRSRRRLNTTAINPPANGLFGSTQNAKPKAQPAGTNMPNFNK